MAMICSYIVLPAGAEAATDTVPTQKYSVSVDNINAYESGEAVITRQNWLSYQAANGNTSLKNFLINEADQ